MVPSARTRNFVTVSVPDRLVKQFFQFDLVGRLKQKTRKLQPKYE
jgi:hypothetical protein